jgi:uncharacterized protein YfaS (alpha-2-macroglobulin family)
VVKAWLVSSDGRRTPGGVPLALYDTKGRRMTARTDADGLATFPIGRDAGSLWVVATDGDPAFARAPAPEAEKPYRVYLYTDRPIYRPGQLVHFRGTVRAARRGVYSLPREKTARVQIKTRGDAVVYDADLPLNAQGTFAGDFQLAPEPPLGGYTLEVELPDDFHAYAQFEVEAYRKPDFEVTVGMPAPHVLNGKPVTVTIGARYFFGSPVSGGKVTYRATFARISDAVPNHVLAAAGLGIAERTRAEDAITGSGRLDATGKLVLTLPTLNLPFDRALSVQAEVTDLSLRARSGHGEMLITGALFRQRLEVGNGPHRPGTTVPVTLHASDYDGKGVVTTATVVLIETREDRRGRMVEERTRQTVTTDADGRAATSFRVERPGDYRLEAWATDAEKNMVYAADGFYVTDEVHTAVNTMLDINPTADQYKPGATAHLRVRTSMTGCRALLTVEGERLYLARVITLTKQEFLLDLPVLEAYRPGVSVRLSAVKDGEMAVGYASLRVPMTEKRLQVMLTPERPRYQPGETAVYTVSTTDSTGRPVPAEVGVAVVDTALYAIRADYTPDPYQAFWPPQPVRVESDYSLNATYPGGSMQVIAEHDATKAGGDARVRKQFEDTALWKASVLTGADGKASVSVPLPDNLTTWRMTARGITTASHAGQATNDIVAAMPLMARLVLPRFYIQGDRATAAALIHNYTGAARTVLVTLSAKGATIDGDAARTITLPANGITRLTWPVTATGAGGNVETATAHFTLFADGGAGARDAMTSTVPVHPNGVRRVDAAAGMTTDRAQITLAPPKSALPGTATLEVSLAPSLAGPIFAALDYLVGYPYGCTEQTLDRLLPDVIVTRALRELHVDRAAPEKLDQYVSFGIQKLLRFQHDDGGWGWWEHDASDPYMTAYVVYGLAMARDAGYPLAASPLPRGTGYLAEALAQERMYPTAAYMLWALAYANRWDDETRKVAVRTGKALYAQRDKLDTYSRASLALALQKMGGQPGFPADLPAMARKLAAELAAKAQPGMIIVSEESDIFGRSFSQDAPQPSTAGVYWTAHGDADGGWLDNDVEVTAQVLTALLTIDPQSAQIPLAVRWLMQNRRGSSWQSTKDTAAAVLALTAYLKTTRELSPHYTVTVRQGGRTLATVTMGPTQAVSDPVRITVPATREPVTLEMTGAGTLYWSAHLAYLLPVEAQTPLQRGISLKREYHVTAEDPVRANVQPVGSMVEVTVTITADRALRYAMLSAPIPAGCEVVAGDAYDGCDRRDIWDNRIVYFFDLLPKGDTTVRYWLRTEAPGAFRVPPDTAELMYLPEVRGESRSAHLTVVEETP